MTPLVLSWPPRIGSILAAVVVVSLLSLGAMPLAAQTGTIQGKVTSLSTGQPVAGAEVTVSGINVGTRTGADGSFALLNVPVGMREVRILAIQKEVGIEDPRRDARRVQRFPPVEPGRAARAEDLLFLEITAALLLSRAAVEVPPRRGAIDARRIESCRREKLFSARPQDPAGGRTDIRPAIEALRQDRREVGRQAAVGIQGQHVTARRGLDAEVHGGRETDILFDREEPHRRAEPTDHVARPIGGVVVYDERFGANDSLRERGSDRERQVRLVVVRDDDDGNVNHREFVICDL